MQSKDSSGWSCPKTEGLLPWLKSCTSWWNSAGSLERACIVSTVRCLPQCTAASFTIYSFRLFLAFVILLLQPVMRIVQLQSLHGATQYCFS